MIVEEESKSYYWRRRRRPIATKQQHQTTNNNGGALLSLFILYSLSTTTTITNAQQQQGEEDSSTTYPDDLFTKTNRVIVTNQAMGARCAVSADFDGDGLQDIVSASSNDNAVSWFRNLGGYPTPTFSIKNEITWSSLGSRIVTVGDVGKFIIERYLLSVHYVKFNLLRWYLDTLHLLTLVCYVNVSS